MTMLPSRFAIGSAAITGVMVAGVTFAALSVFPAPDSLAQAVGGLQALMRGPALNSATLESGGLSEEALLAISPFETSITTPVAFDWRVCNPQDVESLARPVEKQL